MTTKLNWQHVALAMTGSILLEAPAAKTSDSLTERPVLQAVWNSLGGNDTLFVVVAAIFLALSVVFYGWLIQLFWNKFGKSITKSDYTVTLAEASFSAVLLIIFIK